jgi:hypothetical protein
MKEPPKWIYGAKHTISDGWHSFWITRDAAHAPSSYRPAVPDPDNSADDLNALEAVRIGAAPFGVKA